MMTTAGAGGGRGGGGFRPPASDTGGHSPPSRTQTPRPPPCPSSRCRAVTSTSSSSTSASPDPARCYLQLARASAGPDTRHSATCDDSFRKCRFSANTFTVFIFLLILLLNTIRLAEGKAVLNIQQEYWGHLTIFSSACPVCKSSTFVFKRCPRRETRNCKGPGQKP